MNTKILKLRLLSGLLTEPESDAIYGHFCWRMLERSGKEKLEQFIHECSENKPPFLLSDALPFVTVNGKDEVLFPKPQIMGDSKAESEVKEDKIIRFIRLKEKKKRKLCIAAELSEILNSGYSNNEYEVLSPNRHSALRVSVQIDRESLTSAKGNLYTYKPVFSKKEDSGFAVLVKVLDDKLFKDFKCEELLTETFELGFGKKKSSGYGQFKVEPFQDYTEFTEPVEANAFYLLGNYIPAVKDKVIPVAYDYITKYGKMGEQYAKSEYPFKNPVVMLKAGSCFSTKDATKSWFGRITGEGEMTETHPFVRHFGIPYIVRFNLEGKYI